MDHDAHHFRRLAQTQPGVIFASVTANCRNQLGLKGYDGDLTARAPVYSRWYDQVFTPKVHSAEARQCGEEMHLLNTVLDEMLHGRFLEAADVIASRQRCLSWGLEHNAMPIARQFLCYTTSDHSLESPTDVDIAIRMKKKEDQRAKDLRSALLSSQPRAR